MDPPLQGLKLRFCTSCPQTYVSLPDESTNEDSQADDKEGDGEGFTIGPRDVSELDQTLIYPFLVT